MNRSLALLVALLVAHDARAQEERCEHVGNVHACWADATNADVPEGVLAELAATLAAELRARREPVELAIGELRESEVVVRVTDPGAEHELRVALGDLPATDLDARIRTLALSIAEQLDDVSVPVLAWSDERPLATPQARDHYVGFRESAWIRPAEPGLWALAIRARSTPTLDRAGIGLATDLSVEHLVDDNWTLGVEVAPAWLAVGERVEGGLFGGLAALHLQLGVDAFTAGIYGGIAALPRPGTPLAAVFGLRLRLGYYDYIHADIQASLAYAGDLGVILGQVRANVLLPVSRAIEIVAVSLDIAFMLGWTAIEGGIRIWPSERRSDGDFALEITAGARVHHFVQRCEFSDCAPEWGAGGPTLSLGLLSRLR